MRLEFITLQGESRRRIHSVFYKWLRGLSGAVERVYNPIIARKDVFYQSCADFPFEDLDSEANFKLRKFCSNVSEYLNNIAPQLPEEIMEPYSGHIANTFDIESILEKGFEILHGLLEPMQTFYYQNKTCVRPQLEKVGQDVFKLVVDDLVDGRNDAFDEIPSIFEEAYNASNEAMQKLNSILGLLNWCATRFYKTICIKIVVRYFDYNICLY